MIGLLDRYVARKRKQQLSSGSESNIAPAQTAGPSQAAAERGSEGQAIIIPSSSESGTIDQTKPARVARLESKEAYPVLSALQVIPLPIGMRVNLTDRSLYSPGCKGLRCWSGL